MLVRSVSIELLLQIEVLFQSGHFEVTTQASNCHIANKLLVDYHKSEMKKRNSAPSSLSNYFGVLQNKRSNFVNVVIT